MTQPHNVHRGQWQRFWIRNPGVRPTDHNASISEYNNKKPLNISLLTSFPGPPRQGTVRRAPTCLRSFSFLSPPVFIPCLLHRHALGPCAELGWASDSVFRVCLSPPLPAPPYTPLCVVFCDRLRGRAPAGPQDPSRARAGPRQDLSGPSHIRSTRFLTRRMDGMKIESGCLIIGRDRSEM